MRNVTVAVVQMQCAKEVEVNIAKADAMVREAAAKGAKIILLPELFERPYFCQERQYEYYAYATPTAQNPAVQHFRAVAKELGVVLPISFYEKAGTQLFNSIAVLDADGTLLGIYRKTHIPDDHYYQEKFYFTPGDTGFKVWDTRFGRIGIGICWDQWFPETARAMAVKGAELLFYPPGQYYATSRYVREWQVAAVVTDCDSAGHWRRCMQGHAGSNLVPVLAANRIGLETVEPCEANGGQKSALRFYGSSFIADETGALVADGTRDTEQVLTATFDLDKVEENRMSWGVFRDRRPEWYGEITRQGRGV